MGRAIDRRSVLAGLVAVLPGLAVARPAPAGADAAGRRLLFILLRGGWDGLGVVMPLGDPGFAAARGPLAELRPADGAPVKLDGLFALHPAMAEAAAMFRAGQLLAVHAVATPYRERSHFDAQQVLESGGVSPYAVKDGWLNRALPLIGGGRPAVAVAPTVPLALRGPAAVTSHAPSRLPDAPDDLKARVAEMYATDAQLHALWDAALAAEAMAGGDPAGGAGPVQLARMAARFLAGPSGAPAAMVEQGGWDTHAQQAGRLARQLAQLDSMLAAVKAGLGTDWNRTLVIVASEFGRTARANGTGGTDHGTGGLMLLAGGRVRGGRVQADWPGLATGQLWQGRDLRPTTDMRAVLLGAIAAHAGLDPERVRRALFGDAPLQPQTGLVAA